MRFSYADHFGGPQTAGYERLLYDCMIGDQTLFQRADMVEAGWSLIQPILDVWSALPARNFPNYKSGSWGRPRAMSCWLEIGAAGVNPRWKVIETRSNCDERSEFSAGTGRPEARGASGGQHLGVDLSGGSGHAPA
jgi:hypothetical protein